VSKRPNNKKPSDANDVLRKAGPDGLRKTIDGARSKPRLVASNDPATSSPPLLPVMRIKGGLLSEMATEAEARLIAAGVDFYQRGGKLVRPIEEKVVASDKSRTTTVSLVPVCETNMRDQLCQTITWQRYDRRMKQWVRKDPPEDVAKTILARAGQWKFRSVTGVITTQTLRSNGTILDRPGYDEATGLILMSPPSLPEIPAHPSRDDALAALRILEELLDEFPFLDAASRSVALSILITPVVRGAMAVTPMHVARAPAPGSGKSYLMDTASAIAMGQRCHVIAAGTKEEETEKRLAACVLSGYPVISLDNVNGELGGDFLCQVIERPIVSPRILGRSEQPRIPNQVTIFGTGNNMRLVGDMTRRTIICSLDAKRERPELREFAAKPVERVLTDRGRYVAAALTVVRAYFVAGKPGKLPPLASFEDWSDGVRSALVWCGRADPVETMAVARAEDPELQALTAIVNAWHEEIGVGPVHYCTAADLLDKAQEKRPDCDDRGFAVRAAAEWKYPVLREAIESLGAMNPKSMGKWLAARKGRIVGSYRLLSVTKGNQPLRWYLEELEHQP
jgi:putative DNA primase/helicase